MIYVPKRRGQSPFVPPRLPYTETAGGAHSGIDQGLVVEHRPSLLPAAHGPEGARQRPTRPPGRARPWFLEPAVRSGVLTGAPCPSPFAPPTLAGPHQVPERAHGRCLHSQEAPAPGGATSLHPQGPPPWSHPTSRLPGRAGSTPTPLACLCMALPECQAASWPRLWGSVLSSRRWASFLRMSSGALLQQKQRRHAPSLALTPEVSALGTFV